MLVTVLQCPPGPPTPPSEFVLPLVCGEVLGPKHRMQTVPLCVL